MLYFILGIVLGGFFIFGFAPAWIAIAIITTGICIAAFLYDRMSRQEFTFCFVLLLIVFGFCGVMISSHVII